MGEISGEERNNGRRRKNPKAMEKLYQIIIKKYSLKKTTVKPDIDLIKITNTSNC